MGTYRAARGALESINPDNRLLAAHSGPKSTPRASGCGGGLRNLALRFVALVERPSYTGDSDKARPMARPPIVSILHVCLVEDSASSACSHLPEEMTPSPIHVL